MSGRRTGSGAGSSRCRISGAAIAVLTCLLPAAAAAQPSEPYRLKVSHSEGVDLSEDQVRAILRQMSYIVQTDDDGPGGAVGSDDVACDVEFVLDGQISMFSSSDEGPDLDVVREESGIEELFRRTEDVKVVTSIGVCPGASRPELQPEAQLGDSAGSLDVDTVEDSDETVGTWAGCSDGRTFVVAAQESVELSAAAWVHEQGHVAGGSHRFYSPGWIMNKELYEANTQLDAGECARF